MNTANIKTKFTHTSLSFEAYNSKEFVKKYAQKIKTNAFNALYERPASLSLIPSDLLNKKVLDAGCGTGVYSNYLAQHGAKVTAIDFSEEMLLQAKNNTQSAITTLNIDLNDSLDCFKPNEFDVIVSTLVVHYIHDLDKLFTEFYKVLRHKGEVVFSTVHPAYYMPKNGDSYFETELISEVWEEGELMTFYRRSLNSLIEPIINVGFKLDTILEPKPISECKRRFPEIYEELNKKPYFICFKLLKE